VSVSPILGVPVTLGPFMKLGNSKTCVVDGVQTVEVLMSSSFGPIEFVAVILTIRYLELADCPIE
jgi:hypothetical protein